MRIDPTYQKLVSTLVASLGLGIAVLAGVLGGGTGVAGQLAIIGLIVPIVILVSYPRLGIFLLVLMMPFSGATLIPRPLQNAVILGIPFFLFAKYGFRWLAGERLHKDLPREYWFYLVMLFVGCVIGTAHLREITPFLLGEIGEDGKFGLKQYVLGFFVKQSMIGLLPILYLAALRDPRDLKWVPWLIMSSACLFVLGMIYVFKTEGASVESLRGERDTFMALGTHSNTIGGLMVVPFAIALFLQEESRSKIIKLICLGMLVVVLLGTLLSASRGGFTGIVAVTMIYVLKYRRIGAAIVSVMLVMVGLALAPDSVQDRLLQGLDFNSKHGVVASSDRLSSGRLEFWAAMAPEIANHPVLGNGLRSTLWSEYMRSGIGFKVQHPHNMYLEILLDTGIVGMIIYLYLWGFIWRKSSILVRDPELAPEVRSLFAATPGVMAAYFVFGLTNGHSYPSNDQVYFWVYVAAVMVCPISEKAKELYAHASAGSVKMRSRRRMVMNGYISPR